ncbi:MAG TPA: glycosyltransferase family 87 protein, partial [Ktedonobacterales bacterium]|nr:glycosyltransferase family 87 protein [Ktedonobacterales bacterium]
MTISTQTQAIDIDRASDTRHVFRDLLLGQRPRALVLAIASLVFLVSILLHLQVILSTTGASYDMLSYRIQADTVFRHVNVYTATTRYPYPPVWIWIIALVRWVSNTLGARFDAIAKIPATVGDLATVVVLLLYSYRRFGWCWLTLIPMVLYALNPVALLIGAGHGQFDSLVIFFVLLAMYLRGARQDQHIVWGALALGVAIALKGYPALALPYFVVSAPRGSRILTAVVAFVPMVVSVIIYCGLFGFTSAMVTDVLR